MKKSIILSIVVAITLGACSAKEVNEGVDSVTSDISNAINKGTEE